MKKWLDERKQRKTLAITTVTTAIVLLPNLIIAHSIRRRSGAMQWLQVNLKLCRVLLRWPGSCHVPIDKSQLYEGFESRAVVENGTMAGGTVVARGSD